MTKDEDRNNHQQKRPFVAGDSHALEAEAEMASGNASPAATVASATSEDITIARAMQAVETLTSLYGFSWEAANEAIHHANANANASASANADGDLVAICCDYILDHELGVDTGGAIAPIDNCPHVIDVDVDAAEVEVEVEHAIAGGEHHSASHDKGNGDRKSCGCISVTAEDIPEAIFEMPCGYFGKAETVTHTKKSITRPAIGGFKDDIEYSESESGGSRTLTATCPKGENWWCLGCGGIYCSRYINGHGVKHYEQNANANETANANKHCVMIGLADLSVWCHNCGSYLQTHHNERLSSILQRLQDVKFRNDRH